MIFIFNDQRDVRYNIKRALRSHGLSDIEDYPSPTELWEETFNGGTEDDFIRSVAFFSSLVITDYEMGTSNKRFPSFYFIDRLGQIENENGWEHAPIAVYSGYEEPPLSRRYKQLPENAIWVPSNHCTPEQLILSVKDRIIPDREIEL